MRITKRLKKLLNHSFFVVFFSGLLAGSMSLLLLLGIFSFFDFQPFSPLKNGDFTSAASPKPLFLVTTTTIAADLVRQLGGDKVSVTSLMGTGIDPHSYTAREGDWQKILKARAVFYHGLNLEAKMISLFDSMQKSGMRKTYDLSQWVDASKIIKTGQHPDPHLWFDVNLWSNVARGVATALKELDENPANQRHYDERVRDYLAVLNDLERRSRDLFSDIPPEMKIIVTGHDAFSYFARAYGFRILAPRGINAQSQAGIKDLQSLVQQILQKRVGAFFLETSLPSKELYAIEQTVRAQGRHFVLGGKLYSDALGDFPVNTYEKVFWHNAQTIALALKKSMCESFLDKNFSNRPAFFASNKKKYREICAHLGQ